MNEELFEFINSKTYELNYKHFLNISTITLGITQTGELNFKMLIEIWDKKECCEPIDRQAFEMKGDIGFKLTEEETSVLMNDLFNDFKGDSEGLMTGLLLDLKDNVIELINNNNVKINKTSEFNKKLNKKEKERRENYEF